MKYHIWTIGCQMNEADSRHLASRLEQAGGAPCDDPSEADLVILNTCVVRQQAEDKVYGRLRYMQELKQRRPALKIALMGCLVGARKGTSARLKEDLSFVDFFLPPSDPGPLLAALGGAEDAALRSDDERERQQREAIQNEEFHLPSRQKDAVTAHVPVVLGCSHACTYCIIPYRRGAERSRPVTAVVREVEQLTAEGVREVMLLGQIVDRYGMDLPDRPSLAALLKKLARLDGLQRIRFMTSHPNYLAPELLDAVAEEPKLCPHFELPVQSGSDAVLQAMRRGYSVARYRELVDTLRARIPDAAIHTDIIVGFPGETEARYQETVRFVEDLRFDKIHLARYSVRPQTYAARHLADDVPPEEKDRRCRELDDLQRRIQTELNAPLAGRTVEVLAEGRDEKRGRWRGRTPHDRLVFFEAEGDWRGRLARVAIEWAGPYSLVGRLAQP